MKQGCFCVSRQELLLPAVHPCLLSTFHKDRGIGAYQFRTSKEYKQRCQWLAPIVALWLARSPSATAVWNCTCASATLRRPSVHTFNELVRSVRSGRWAMPGSTKVLPNLLHSPIHKPSIYAANTQTLQGPGEGAAERQCCRLRWAMAGIMNVMSRNGLHSPYSSILRSRETIGRARFTREAWTPTGNRQRHRTALQPYAGRPVGFLASSPGGVDEGCGVCKRMKRRAAHQLVVEGHTWKVRWEFLPLHTV